LYNCLSHSIKDEQLDTITSLILLNAHDATILMSDQLQTDFKDAALTVGLPAGPGRAGC